jgi:hypothetical protein
MPENIKDVFVSLAKYNTMANKEIVKGFRILFWVHFRAPRSPIGLGYRLA